MQLLIKAGADVDKAKTNGATPLFIASDWGHGEIVKLLIKAGADVNKALTTDGATPLFIACQKGHDKIVKLLLASGADASLPTIAGFRPINIACCFGHEQVLSTLLAYNADASPHNGQDLIELATSKGHLGCVKILEEWPSKQNQVAVKLCVSELKKQGTYEAIRETPNNELTKPQFAFKVIEMMKSCCMYGLADNLIEYVGTNVEGYTDLELRLMAENAALKAEGRSQGARIAALESRVGMNIEMRDEK